MRLGRGIVNRIFPLVVELEDVFGCGFGAINAVCEVVGDGDRVIAFRGLAGRTARATLVTRALLAWWRDALLE